MSKRQFGSVRRLPSGGWQARYWDQATDKMVSLGVFPTKAKASAQLDAARTDMGRGGFVNPAAGRVTFTGYGATWLAERDLRPRTRDEYTGLLSRHLEPTFGDTDIGAITPSAVRSWHSALNRDHPATAAKSYRLLRAILATAVDDELIVRNPCKVAGGGVDRSAERPVASVAEVSAATTAMPERLAIAVTLAAWCGLRRQEVLGLRRRDVDLVADVLRIEQTANQLSDGTIVFGPPKTDAGVRSVAIPPNVVSTLADQGPTLTP